MFILSRVEQAVSLVELAEMAPCELEEAMARVRALVELGVLELFLDEEAEQHDEARERRTSTAPRPMKGEGQSASTDDRNDPPTGVHVRLDPDAQARKRVLIGAITLGRVRRRKQT